MKSAEQLGREARERNSNSDLNPFEGINKYKAEKWLMGWIDKEVELFIASGMSELQWERYCQKTLK